jgi:uncharacterized lipoprotein NlpE involved in copper resistance
MEKLIPPLLHMVHLRIHPQPNTHSTVRDEGESPASPNQSAKLKRKSNATSKSRDEPYQGVPLKSGACADCSGNPPDIWINAVTNNPAHPPPINAASTHHKETIGSPLRA